MHLEHSEQILSNHLSITVFGGLRNWGEEKDTFKAQ
jgi:hypothetical protein